MAHNNDNNSDSAIINIFLENLNKMPVKRLSASLFQVQTVRKQQKSYVNQF